ncbi:hypothetical protein [Ectopseudomonas hydrolytica]|jgi:hypothetical protein|uniref:hypothetical protein n=1 Tax=Ectopseudomonas hydrolytica TaxID=2493633 RepID=UPI0002786FED|nr:hypothetical protein [Pseudomonas hydrolytica]EJO91813.1 hypothetical protein A471_20764 [Pseudomonas mendocina DLHK]MBF8162156.1 hypothetical protein [Pseudomonas mendocina]UTH31222.1 hypothetical protein NLY38_22765 [Pseudomonas hydrolytica]UZZ10423.1 hypothetical protein NDO41_24040 [Pseudomonas mendocina]
MRALMQFSACLALGLVVAVMILIGLMFFGWFNLIDGLLLTGKPLAHLSLVLLPDGFWSTLSGLPDAASNSSLRSFLALCAALGQLGLLLALGFMRLWYRA